MNPLKYFHVYCIGDNSDTHSRYMGVATIYNSLGMRRYLLFKENHNSSNKDLSQYYLCSAQLEICEQGGLFVTYPILRQAKSINELTNPALEEKIEIYDPKTLC